MTVIGWHGDPCEACLTDRDRARERGETLPPVQSVSEGCSLCVRHYQAASSAVRAVEALGMPRGPVPFLGVVDWESPVLSDWLGGKAA